MLNPKTSQVAQMIAEAFPLLLIEREGNVVTLEDGEGTRFLVTVESVYSPTNEDTPLPDIDSKCAHPNHPNFPDDCLFPKPE